MRWIVLNSVNYKQKWCCILLKENSCFFIVEKSRWVDGGKSDSKQRLWKTKCDKEPEKEVFLEEKKMIRNLNQEFPSLLNQKISITMPFNIYFINHRCKFLASINIYSNIYQETHSSYPKKLIITSEN